MDDLEILRIVVEFVFVNVVNQLRRIKLPTDGLFRNGSMHINFLAVDLRLPIARLQFRIGFLFTSLARPFAKTLASEIRVRFARLLHKHGSARFTGL